MKAIRFHETGGPEVLRLEELALPEPGPGQARVRHTAIGVNFIDTYHRTGLYKLPLPSGLGVEAAGVVEAVGQGVGHVAVGDRVAYVARPPGAYAEAAAVAADRLVRIPEGVSDEVAAAAMLKGMTVWMLLRRIHAVKPGGERALPRRGGRGGAHRRAVAAGAGGAHHRHGGQRGEGSPGAGRRRQRRHRLHPRGLREAGPGVDQG